jgi:hypothetical protein
VGENATTGNGKTNVFPVSFSSDGEFVSWSHPDGPFELYLMPAPSLDTGTQAYYQLVGAPAVPPRYAFGFIASRWGWEDAAYIDSILQRFRNGSYPIDAMIGPSTATTGRAHCARTHAAPLTSLTLLTLLRSRRVLTLLRSRRLRC